MEIKWPLNRHNKDLLKPALKERVSETAEKGGPERPGECPGRAMYFRSLRKVLFQSGFRQVLIVSI
jgi:hypothetical protein